MMTVERVVSSATPKVAFNFYPVNSSKNSQFWREAQAPLELPNRARTLMSGGSSNGKMERKAQDIRNGPQNAEPDMRGEVKHSRY